MEENIILASDKNDSDMVRHESVLTGNTYESEEAVSRNYSGLALAYIGDSIFDLYIKDYFVRKNNMQTEKYHKVVTGIVKAVNQAALIDRLIEEEKLTETELEIYKRGRNSSVHTKAKNATMGEYKKATGFESVLGFNYLTGNKDRLAFFAGEALSFAGYLDR